MCVCVRGGAASLPTGEDVVASLAGPDNTHNKTGKTRTCSQTTRSCSVSAATQSFAVLPRCAVGAVNTASTADNPETHSHDEEMSTPHAVAAKQ